ncbi:MAG: DNA alkylation repair protein [Pedosphaera sp. Tous-C6FEB]|nr:MAG: DNA alkylation repair protein [Pedosphaera sp. Tous-C6FEB]
MTLAQTLQQLEAAGSAQTRKTYARHGIGPNMFGVSYATLGKLTRAIKRDQALALGLWASGNHDARVLATMIADPAQATVAQLHGWVGACENCALVGAVATFTATTAVAADLAAEWCADPREFVAVAGWDVVAKLALASSLPDAHFATCLKTVEREIHAAPNYVRYAMNGAVIAIGVRNSKLEQLAVAAAKRIGKVEVDHGDTSCRTPDAVAYIAKTKAHRAERGKK